MYTEGGRALVASMTDFVDGRILRCRQGVPLPMHAATDTGFKGGGGGLGLGE